MENALNFLSTKNGFNSALKHFKIVNNFIRECERQNNLADLINDAIKNNLLKKNQLKAILNVILTEKFKYYSKSMNLSSISNKSLSDISNEINQWNLFDIVVLYHHPQLGTTLINPKSAESWQIIGEELKENELIVVYVGYYGNDFDNDLAKNAADSLINLLQGKKTGDTKKFKTQPMFSPKPQEFKPEPKKTTTPIPTTTTSSSQKVLSPKYGIVVTNELFHNGNVEAWKKIIESYETTYPDMEVLVFYDNEQIHDINTLFKWGKVKNGTMIFFSLLGPEFRNISKLRRYLVQGASPRFEAFLKAGPGKILPLF